MTTPHQRDIRELLKQAMPPTNGDLERDLWPQVLCRMNSQPLQTTVPWFDWALAACLVGVACAFPGLIPLLLYHL